VKKKVGVIYTKFQKKNAIRFGNVTNEGKIADAE